MPIADCRLASQSTINNQQSTIRIQQFSHGAVHGVAGGVEERA
jgi:hypothetical protein